MMHLLQLLFSGRIYIWFFTLRWWAYRAITTLFWSHKFPLSPSIILCCWPWVRLWAFSHFYSSYRDFNFDWTGKQLSFSAPHMNKTSSLFQFQLCVTFLFTFSKYFSLLLVYDSMWALAFAIVQQMCMDLGQTDLKSDKTEGEEYILETSKE